MQEWCELGKVQSFIQQNRIADSIEDANASIDKLYQTLQVLHLFILYPVTGFLTHLQLAAVVETSRWQSEFQHFREIDHAELVRQLSDISTMQGVMNETLQVVPRMAEQVKDLHSVLMNPEAIAMMRLMQESLTGLGTGDERHLGIQRNLHHLQKKSGKLLPHLELSRGEVRRIGKNAVGGSASMDIWEGLYLDEEKVAIKVRKRQPESTCSHRLTIVALKVIRAVHVKGNDRNKIVS
jgi:hypothetical protein